LRLTSKALEKINLPYRIVIEPQEFDHYSAVIDPAKILTLPFSNHQNDPPYCETELTFCFTSLSEVMVRDREAAYNFSNSRR
jgi:hypothetical protein